MEKDMGYLSDLTDEQWAVAEPIVTYKTEEELYKGGRPRIVDLRVIVNALLYMDRTGVQWRVSVQVPLSEPLSR